MAIEVLREVWRVTKWKDGCVYRTEYVEDRWLPIDEAQSLPDKNLVIGFKGTSFEGPTIRRVPDGR